jgi:predicted MFS family arabinose efflux permease
MEQLSRRLTVLMAISVGVIVANIYYAQPLLANIAHDFSAHVTTMGLIAMLTQIGTATGMLCFVPLGDKYNRRTLICGLLLASSFLLVGVAVAPNLFLLGAASFGVGAAASAVHVIVPFAAHLSPPQQRGRVVGTVLSGLLLGILTARSFSGFVGSWLGWRAVYWIAAIMMLLLAALLRSQLPNSVPQQALSWPEMARSIAGLLAKYRQLRKAAFSGAMLFASFSAFWTTLAFLLAAPPYHYGASVAGLFGLVGAAGAAAAPFVGRFADSRGPGIAVLLGILITIFSFFVLMFGASSMTALIGGVVLIDLGVQSGQVANQTRIYALDANARSRLNSVYMFCYFCGGALGSSLAAVCWSVGGWIAVCLLGLAFLLLALSVSFKPDRVETKTSQSLVDTAHLVERPSGT